MVFCVSFIGKHRFLTKAVLIMSAVLLTALLAVVASVCFNSEAADNTGYVYDLGECAGVGGFLSQFSLDYDSQISSRELTFPSKDDAAFADYGDFLSKLGMNVLRFSGKRVEERYLKLKNKTEKGQTLYAVVYIYKEKVAAAHLTTLQYGDELLPVTAFV